MEGGKVLARYEQSAREFLYPTPTLTGKDGMDRELLLSRTVHFTVSVQEPLWIMYMYLTLLPSLIKLSSDVMFGRCSGFMVSALFSKSSSRSLSPGLMPGQDTLPSQYLSPPRCITKKGTGVLNARGSPAMD